MAFNMCKTALWILGTTGHTLYTSTIFPNEQTTLSKQSITKLIHKNAVKQQQCKPSQLINKNAEITFATSRSRS